MIHCPDCGRWSPKDEWEEHDEYDGDELVEPAVVCPHCGRHRPPTSRTTNEGDRVTDEATSNNRWRAFDDDELLELRAGCMEREEVRALPTELREHAGRLGMEIYREMRRRHGIYRGPGVYVSPDGVEYEVYGLLGSDAVSRVVFRPDARSDVLTTMPRGLFESVGDNRVPSFRWVRALGEESS